MYAVITRVKLVAGKSEEAARRFRVRVPDATRGVAGFITSSLTVDDAGEEVTVVGMWASKEAFEAFRDSDRYADMMKSFAELFAGPPEQKINRVLETIEARVATLTY